MLNEKDPSKYTRSVRPLVPRSPEEQLALYARGPDDLEAARAWPQSSTPLAAGARRVHHGQPHAAPWCCRRMYASACSRGSGLAK